MIRPAAHAGTALVLLLAATLAGCPDTNSPADDTGTRDGGGQVIHDCTEAMRVPLDTPCDFTGSCGDGCVAPFTTMCLEGRVTRLPLGCADASRFDAGWDPTDAGADAPALDAYSMCAPEAPPLPCRSDSDCTGGRFGEHCVAPGENPGCGICVRPEHLCDTDADCPAMDPATPLVCERFFNPCGVGCGGDGWGTQCIAACTETSCAAGEQCLADGHCAPISCMAGYECPLGTTCIDRAAGVDAHGCLRLTCTADTDCPCGTGCVEGRCYDRLGVCEPPRA